MSATSVDPQRPKGQDNKVQNGSLHQKDTVHDNDFEPYLSGQSNQLRNNLMFGKMTGVPLLFCWLLFRIGILQFERNLSSSSENHLSL
uniref:YTH N6-methyladenosine RNA binding protein 1 n=1 Tax=Gallus gallus TaxID=9031 RepID=A0A8V0ZQW4_CHICK